MPYLLGDLDDRQVYHPRKLREANFSGATYDVRTRRLERAEFAMGIPRIPKPRIPKLGGKLGGMAKAASQRIGKVAGAASRSRLGTAVKRGFKGTLKRARVGIGKVARTGMGRGLGRLASRATGMIGGKSAMRKVGSAFRSARRFSSPYLLSTRANFSERQQRQQALTARFSRY